MRRGELVCLSVCLYSTHELTPFLFILLYMESYFNVSFVLFIYFFLLSKCVLFLLNVGGKEEREGKRERGEERKVI